MNGQNAWRLRRIILLGLWSGAASAASNATATAPVPAPTFAPSAAQPAAPQLPGAQVMVVLIRSSLSALGQANMTNNYTVLNALGSAGFRAVNPPERLAVTFQSFRTHNIDLSPVVLLEPQLTAAPVISNGRMRLVGIFPSSPMRVNFDLTFEPDRGSWKLFGLGVNLSPGTPAAAK